MQDDGKGEIFRGQRILHRRRGRCPLAPTSFSCLDARKGSEKKIKASPRPGNLAGYRILSLFIFCFLLSRVGASRIRPPNDPLGAGAGRWEGEIFFRRTDTSSAEGLSSPPETLGGRIRYAPTLPAGDVSYLYLKHLPRTPAFLLFIFPFSMSPVGAYRIRPTNDPAGAGAG